MGGGGGGCGVLLTSIESARLVQQLAQHPVMSLATQALMQAPWAAEQARNPNGVVVM